MPGRLAARALAAAVATLLLGSGCGTPTAPSATASPSAHQVSAGPSNCQADSTQDITFAGAVTGHLACQSTPTNCLQPAPEPSKLIATIPVRVDGKPATLTVSVGGTYGLPGHGPGTYQVPGGIGAGDPQFELQLADMTTWVSSPGGIVTVLTDDGARVRGTVEGGLTGPSAMTIKGSWGCKRPGA